MSFKISRRAFAASAALVPIACTNTGPIRSSASSAAIRKDPIVNPLIRNRADAQIFRHDDGYYYMTGSVPEYDRLVLRRAPTIAGLADAEERVLWRHRETGPMSGFLWAPELHLVDGRWTMYFAAGPSGGGEDVFRIRTYAVVCDSNDPMRGNWSVLGEFKGPWDSFNLDSTIFYHNGTRYFAWAQREPGIETNSNIYIAPMASPLTLAAAPARLSVPELDWEIRGFKVNEAQAILQRNGKLFMTYSASATDDRYVLGLLTADADANIMDPASWTKSPQPVFQTSVATSVFGPGHNSFTVDENGHDMLVYHGRDYKEIEGDPLFNPDRHTRVQRLYYNADGSPEFGVPVGNGPLPDRYAAPDRAGTFLAHQDQRLMAGSAPLPQTQFRAWPQAGGAIRLSPILLRDQHLVANADGSVSLGTAVRAGADMFRRLPGPTDGTVRVESLAFPGKALGREGGDIVLADIDSGNTVWTLD